jgi:ribosome-binding factor A
MKNQSSWSKTAAKLCVEFGEEDGIDPRYLSEKTQRQQSSLKTLQLCKEALHVFSLVLTGEVQDPLLSDLQIVSVQPEQNGQALCVTVCQTGFSSDVSEKAILAALQKVQGLLRCALAQALHRKHTPALTFKFAISQGGV